MWYNVDSIVVRIESEIYFDSKTTYLYDSQFFLKKMKTV